MRPWMGLKKNRYSYQPGNGARGGDAKDEREGGRRGGDERSAAVVAERDRLYKAWWEAYKQRAERRETERLRDGDDGQQAKRTRLHEYEEMCSLDIEEEELAELNQRDSLRVRWERPRETEATKTRMLAENTATGSCGGGVHTQCRRNRRSWSEGRGERQRRTAHGALNQFGGNPYLPRESTSIA